MGVLLILVLICCPAGACINEYEEYAPKSNPEAVFGKHEERDWKARVRELEARLSEGDFRVKNDYAAALIRVGEAARAVEVLEAVEKEHPGEYIVAANLGTAYELSGDLKQAYRWIEEGMRRDATGHDGTEWLHLAILTAREQQASDPRWLETHSVLAGNTHDDAETRKALRYQLHERMWFVKPPDPVVADLLAELARLVENEGKAKEAADLYHLALDYKPLRPRFAQDRLQDLKQEIRAGQNEPRTQRRTSDQRALLAGLTVLILAIVLAVLRRARPKT